MVDRLELDDIVADVVRKDIKNVHLRVYPPTGTVRISAPLKMKLDTIRIFAISKIGWIRKQQQKLNDQECESRREYLDRESHYLWGKRYLLKVVEKNAAPVVKLNNSDMVLQIRPGATEAKRRSVVDEWYRQQVKEEASSLIEKWEREMEVSVENFSECYHCPVAHRWVVTNIWSANAYQINIDNNVVRHFSERLNDRTTHGDLHIWFMWPNLAIEMYPIHRCISVRHFDPRGPRDTMYSYLWYADQNLSQDKVDEVIELAKTYPDTNGAEDAAIVASVQQGLESRAYDVGQLVVTPSVTPQSEHGVAHFQSMYLDAISV